MRELNLARVLLVPLLALTVASSRAELSEGYRAFSAGNYEQALDELLPLAGQNNLIASYYVGLMYVEGRGVARNPQTGVSWLARSAEQGHTGAQLRLAWAYEYGEGVLQDYRLAARWMLAASEGGNADAQYHLGRLYHDGRGIVQSDQQAYEWIHRSVEYGVSHDQFLDALLYLGAALEWGRGLRQDLVGAYQWFALAASYSINDERIHDEASRAMDALSIRMTSGELAEARSAAEAWRAEKDTITASR